jgi:hypothetical protein
MTSTMEYAMGVDSNQVGEQEKMVGPAFGLAAHDLDQQRLRILRCTAYAMASSPGGLRFKAGSRPWLDQLSSCSPPSAAVAGRRENAVLRAARN